MTRIETVLKEIQALRVFYSKTRNLRQNIQKKSQQLESTTISKGDD